MKKMLFSIALIAMMFSFQGCVSPSTIDAGEEGVLVKKPWVFGSGGVEAEPIKTGLTWTVWSTQVVRVDIKPFNISESFDDMITKDNNPVDFDVHMTFKHQEGKTPILIEKFGLANSDGVGGWYNSKIKQPLRNDVRDFVKEHSMFEISTNPVIVAKLQDALKASIQKFINENGIPTDLVQVSVGKVMPPESVVKATLETAAQKQNVLTQEARVKAEQAREIAERASAQADKAYMQEMGMSAQQYLKNKELDIIDKKENVQVFLGAMPQPVVMNK